MNHTDLQDATVKLLSMTGWSHLHVRKSIGRGHKHTTATNVKGWPDLFCWSPRQPGRFLALEVKVLPDWLSDDQAVCLSGLASSGIECFVLVENAQLAAKSRVVPRGLDVVGLFDDLPSLLRATTPRRKSII